MIPTPPRSRSQALPRATRPNPVPTPPPRDIGRPVGHLGVVSGLSVLAMVLATHEVALGVDPVRVTTTRPATGEITRYVALPGTLRANQQVTVQARVAGFVRSITVDRGDRVSAGQTLAEIEVPELLAEKARQLAEVKVAEAEARRLETARQRSPDLVTAQSLDTATGRLEVARADLEKTSTLLRYANLTAPFSGTVTGRFVDPGAFVPAGAGGGASAVVTLVDTTVIRALVGVPETDAVRIRPGQPVRVSVEGSGPPLAATVSRHAGALDEDTRVRTADSQLRIARLQGDQWRDEIIREVVELRSRAEMASGKVDATTRTVAAANRLADLTRARRDFGIGVVLEALEAERDLVRAKAEHLQALADHNRTQRELWRASGLDEKGSGLP